MWPTCALLIALATAGAPAAAVTPQPGEPPRAYACRSVHVPEARACAERCERAFAGQAQRDAAWECVLSCSRRTQHAIADCRRTTDAEPSPLAAR